MNRLWIYGLLVAVALVIPGNRCDLGSLQPVETVSLYKEEGRIVVETDTGAVGKGDTLSAALDDMKDTTAGVIYLDTANYLLVRRETEELIPQIRKYLKGSVRVCRVQAAVKVEEATSYLNVHMPKVKLAGWKTGETLPFLRISDGRLLLDEK